jgi:hypothetical protein
MDRRAVPYEEQLAFYLAHEMLQEAHHIVSLEGALLLYHVELAFSRVMALIAERWSRLRCSLRMGVCPTGA